MEKFHFHPKELVYKIVSIYVNLGQRSEFCRALPQDGRSFSLDLMEAAADIMRLVACAGVQRERESCTLPLDFFVMGS